MSESGRADGYPEAVYPGCRHQLVGGRLFSCLNDLLERPLVAYSYIRQHLSIQLDTRLFQTVDELTVGKPMLLDSSSDTNNPESAKGSLFLTRPTLALCVCV